jgi:Fic family protein
MDGNSCTGCINNLLFLLQVGLLEIPALYLRRYIIQNKQEYYRLLHRVTEESYWQGWLLFMLTAVEQTALWAANRIHVIRSLLDETTEHRRVDLPRHVYSKELVELMFVQPYIKVKNLVDVGIAQRQTASVYFHTSWKSLAFFNQISQILLLFDVLSNSGAQFSI